MFWGAIGPGYKSPLILCSGGVDAPEYLQIIEKANLVADLDSLYGKWHWYFMQDGAPAHTAKNPSPGAGKPG